MVGLCYRCKEPGHKAMFCYRSNAPNDKYPDSGVQAWAELPLNTTRWKTLKSVMQQAVLDLETATTPEARKDLILDVMQDAFASGWRYCCMKKRFNSHSHEASEPNSVRQETTATATTDSESEEDIPDSDSAQEASQSSSDGDS